MQVNFNDVVKQIKPPKDMACLDCPFAIWRKSIATNYTRDRNNQNIGIEYYEQRTSYKNINCYCSKMFKTTFDVSNLLGEISIKEFDYVIECEGKGE